MSTSLKLQAARGDKLCAEIARKQKNPTFRTYSSRINPDCSCGQPRTAEGGTPLHANGDLDDLPDFTPRELRPAPIEPVSQDIVRDMTPPSTADAIRQLKRPRGR